MPESSTASVAAKPHSVFSRADGSWDIHVQEHRAMSGYAAVISIDISNVIDGALFKISMNLPLDAAFTLGDVLGELQSEILAEVVAEGILP